MTFNSLILIWFEQNKRNLAWRLTKNPYKIWLSEIILQQTRIAQGSAYYDRFVEEFPTIFDLANADEQAVLKLWQGLGYYSRARNLHFTAKQIAFELNGNFPNNFNDLKKLKGVGDYTAAAIASICFDEAVPAVDGNAYRVYARYFNIDLDIMTPQAKKYFFELGLEIIDQANPGDFNQAVMELGATVCTPKSPKCEICPVHESCEGLAKNRISDLPVKLKKIKVKNRYLHLLHISNEDKLLLKKQSGKDVWRNLFLFPMIEKENLDSKELEQLMQVNFEIVHEEKHILTHQNLFITFWKSEVELSKFNQLSSFLESEIVINKNLEYFPVPRPIEKYILDKISH